MTRDMRQHVRTRGSKACTAHAIDDDFAAGGGVLEPAGPEAEQLQALPDAPTSFCGASQHQGKNYTVKVTNPKGYMSHVLLEAEFPGVNPIDVFAILTNPNNAGVFRSIKDVGERILLESQHDGKVRTLEIEQVGETHFLWMRREFTTRLRVYEDEQDPLRPCMTFSLIKADLVTAFDGVWQLEPLTEPPAKEGQRLGCKLILTQDVSPKGVPVFMRRMPVMGGMLRGAIQRAVCDVVEDVTAVVNLVVSEGITVQQAIQERKRLAGVKGLGDHN